MEEKKNMNDPIDRTNVETVEIKKTEKPKGWWASKTKGQKVTFILSIVILLISIAAVILWANIRYLVDEDLANTILGYYLDGETKVYYANGWQKIWHHITASSLSWIATFFIIAITIVLVFIIHVLIHLFTARKSRKTQTVGSLLKSLSKYIAILVDIALILSVFGVDVAGILAGVGVLTLVIGLGCQSLIQDVISGLFIVFDDYFAVGDVVIIDGFRGTISEVGLKTTKLVDAGGNIKSISNSQIATVVNLSRMDSMITVTIGCAYEEDIIRVEGLIASSMEEFAAKIPAITKGPYYKGIDCVNTSSIDFLVLCFCKEADRFQVTRDLKRELVLLFRNNNVIIPYTQISINRENDKNRPTATDVQTMWSEKANNDNRGITNTPKKKKKKSIIAKVADSVKAVENDNK